MLMGYVYIHMRVIYIYALVSRVNLPPHGMVPQTRAPAQRPHH